MKIKFCFNLSEKVENLVSNKTFNSFIMIAIVLNTVTLMTEHYEQP